MSAAPGSHLRRARIAEALSAVLANRAHRELGRALGIAGTTVSARGDDLQAWPTSDLLSLASQDEALGQAVVAFIQGDHIPQGEAVRLQGELVQELADEGAVIKATAEAIQEPTPTHLKALADARSRAHAHEAQVDADIAAALQRHA